MARPLISVFEAHVNGKRGELRAALGHSEELGYNYKLVRGLAAVLEARCSFETRASVDPAEARRAVFEEVGGRVVVTEEERGRAIAAAASRLGVSAGELDASLYADLWDEQVLTDFEAPTPRELIKEYNFALTLALLMQSRRIELLYGGVDGDLERLGREVGRCRIHVAGGVSSLIIERRPSRRAGQRSPALGALLAHVMLKDGWRVKAEVPQRSKARGAHLFEISEESEGGIVTPSDLKRWMTVGAGGRTEPTGRPFNDIVVIDELASKLGVTEAEARRRLRRSGRSYVELGDVHVTREKLEELEGALAAAPDLRLPTVLGILRGLSCRRPFPVLEALGYAVEWGEDRESSTVRRLRRRPTTP